MLWLIYLFDLNGLSSEGHFYEMCLEKFSGTECALIALDKTMC